MLPTGPGGAVAKKLLREAGVSFITIYKDPSSRISLSLGDQSFPWYGLKGVKSYLSYFHKK